MSSLQFRLTSCFEGLTLFPLLLSRPLWALFTVVPFSASALLFGCVGAVLPSHSGPCLGLRAHRGLSGSRIPASYPGPSSRGLGPTLMVGCLPALDIGSSWWDAFRL